MEKYNPTDELYELMTQLFNVFNNELFDNQLPNVLFTTQRQPHTMGYYSANRWKNTNDVQCDEIALNPMYIGKSTVVEMMQTLVHEMCHEWQHYYGKSGKNGYHNSEWANKMFDVGLMPSSTGRVGGEKTGYKMNDYPIPDGKFLQVCNKVMNDNTSVLSKLWVDRFSLVQKNLLSEPLSNEDIEVSNLIANVVTDNTALTPIEQVTNIQLEDPEKPVKRKFKFSCLSCKMNVWGGKNVKVKCGNCNIEMIKES